MHTRPGNRPGFSAIKQRLEAAATDDYEWPASLPTKIHPMPELQPTTPTADPKPPKFSRIGVRQVLTPYLCTSPSPT